LQLTTAPNLPTPQTSIKPIALQADTYRYQGSMVLYAVPIVIILLLLFCALLVNFHFGTNLATLLLLVLLVLAFLLAAVLALVLAVLADVCPAVEPVLLSRVPSNLAPIADYYFRAQGADVKTVLRDAGLVDVDAVLAQAVAGKDDVAASITADYVFRWVGGRAGGWAGGRVGNTAMRVSGGAVPAEAF